MVANLTCLFDHCCCLPTKLLIEMTRHPQAAQALVLVTALLGAPVDHHNYSAHGFSASCSSSSSHHRDKRFTTTTSALHSSLSSNNHNHNNNDYSYLRWNKSNDNNHNHKWELQTAVTVLEHPTKNHTLELHAQLHFGDEEYFSYYNTRDFQDRCDAIHYELLVDEDLLLELDDSSVQRRRVLKEPIHIQAAPNDERFAQSYGWHCQVNCIDYTTKTTQSSPNNNSNKWIHADLTRQEFIQLLDQTDASSSSEKPLWQLATNGPSPQSSSAAAEAVSALLVGPPTLSFYNDSMMLKRRLFTNLFLPGDALANGLRALLWMTVPAPELSILLLDWSSLLPTTSNKTNGVSQVAVPLLTSLTRWDWMAMRRLVFGQMIVASTTTTTNSDNDNQSWSLLVTNRNDHALDVVQQTFHTLSSSSESSSSSTTRPTTVALLYGSSHCPDLHRKLVQNLGFVPIQTEWRTAWSIDIMDNHNSDGITTRREEDSSSSSVLPPTMSRSWTTTILPLLIIYLGIGALDWMELLGDVSTASGSGEYWNVAGICGLYLVRHVLLYLGWSKFLVDWK